MQYHKQVLIGLANSTVLIDTNRMCQVYKYANVLSFPESLRQTDKRNKIFTVPHFAYVSKGYYSRLCENVMNMN